MRVDTQRVENLKDYVKRLMNKEDGKELYLQYRTDIEQVTPQEAFEIFYSQVERGQEPSKVLLVLDKVINIFYKSLSNYQWKWPAKDTFMDYLIRENAALTQRLENIKRIIKEKTFSQNREELIIKIQELTGFDGHYLKKENILFPYMERKAKKYEGLTIMWELHDETRRLQKSVIECLKDSQSTEKEFNTEIGKLFFAMFGLIQKEELMLFPSASEIIADEEWEEMLRQSLEYEFPFIERPEMSDKHQRRTDYADNSVNSEINDSEECIFRTETGALSFEQILLIFNNLPVDLTFVDENDKVRYFTRPKDRIFPRSPAVIGRDVEKCHPPQSVHVVRNIIEEFKNGTQNTASFWINLKGKMLLIQYFALRDSRGIYKGVLEVSQDVTQIRQLEGERRLLQWEKTNPDLFNQD